uniref:Multiple inositol polyphosphate phosphatase 1 n=1 Tax=Kalanchoe fedtschenkoi TaxID=63787 RepID=A0A7N0ZUM4_KALFE
MSRATSAALLLIFCCSLSSVSCSKAEEHDEFDVRRHLSTVTRYGAVLDVADNSFVASSIPEGCTPIHLNLVARHGTRSPTKKRIKELNKLGSRLEELVKGVNGASSKAPAWFSGWQSPWKGKLTGGELVKEGEDELYQLGLRTRQRFPSLFDEEYHPDVYNIRSSQVSRASASAVAFGMGLFSGKGNLGPGKHRAFSVTSESRASDTVLRFHDCCDNYKDFRKSQGPAIDQLKQPILDEVTSAISYRYKLNFTTRDTASLWFLCKQEASLLNITDRACGLFSPHEASLLEWADDLEMFVVKGYGNSLNYRMGVPLLEDVLNSMEQAIKAKEDGLPSGSYEKARLRFAHAETVVPFSCLLGLFLEGSEFEKIQKEEPLQPPPRPPQKRNWRGSTVAPFAGNNMLVLYSCPASMSSEYFIQVLHNEHPIPMPGCENSDFCPFEVFKEKVVAPHSKHDYDSVCKVKATPKPGSSKLLQFFRWLLFLEKEPGHSHSYEL